MENSQSKAAYLLLEDGTLFQGKALGKIGTSAGEICFNTGMTGYQEIYTDPSYFGQVIVNTTSHIGNYGIKLGDEEESSSVKIKGMVCNAFAETYSRITADGSLQEYFEKAGIVGISDVDTRQIVRHVRNAGVMNCIISSEISDPEALKEELSKCPSMEGLELSSIVSTKEPYFFGDESAELKLAVLDLGCKTNILRNFSDRGCYMKVFNAKADAHEMIAWNPDGFFISNGPGDPGVMDYAVDTVNALLETGKPLFGICLGHQILSRACGIGTYKMHNGHRGLNHPVKNLVTGKSEITSQNHGFAVSADEAEKVSDSVEITHLNLNDKTVEGIRLKGKPAFSVQYHPEAAPGPHDSRYLFDDFVAMMKA
ncbi:glutamine-hydrolyzing carbamoyl-phosphate synthase small subunit [Marinilongibacter aquaticus]|uniref:glutamine-hydrolyzing carbamoyl-phosphate synthase small subunit n=1 Tax=Marinilongibacter aquaticus TaxID=2975157 RepID=UPI0021BD5093|nr:glutamine-hydrolyzing carbamoyl-phosphate synthase small subunit [Marinilongibacter aquaticus]UBM59739.1 glutamine-hydrolyzing carbamoyl-phosphate synthase small subunit [Marinilongibacter aquaticus]